MWQYKAVSEFIQFLFVKCFRASWSSFCIASICNICQQIQRCRVFSWIWQEFCVKGHMAWCELESSIIFNLQWYIVHWYIQRCNTKTDLPMISAIVVKNYSEMDVLLSYIWNLVGSIKYTLIADALPALTQQYWWNMTANARLLINSLRPSVTHIHVSKLTIIGPDNDFTHGRR